MRPDKQLKQWIFAARIFGKGLTWHDYLKITRYIFLKRILQKNIPVSAVFAITYRCQCNCVHCSVGAYKSKPDEELTTWEIKNAINALSKLWIFKITFFGGEPLLREDMFELLNYAGSLRMRVSIDTNGLALTPEVVKKLKLAKIANVNISLDSPDPDIHDKLRGVPGCFERAISGIKLCVAAGIPCLVSTYASKRAIANGDMKKLISLSRSLGASGVKILLPIISGKWLGSMEEKLSLQEEEEVRKLLDPLFVYIEDALSMLRNSSKRCSSLDKNFFYISPFGDIQLCPAVPLSFGNIRHHDLSSIVKKMWAHPTSNIKCEGCLINNKVFRDRYFSKITEKNNLPISAYET
jgi:MoaA/NifB/PqqE/SkfB family radical SAM enzyme